MRKLTLMFLLIMGTLVSAQEKPLTQLVGHWVAANRSKGGIGSIWEFKPDGTLIMAPGAVVDMPYKLEGDTLTLPPKRTGPDAKPQVLKIRFDGDAMDQEVSGSAGPPLKMRYIRITPAKGGEPPIVGKWKLAPLATANPNLSPTQLQMQQAYANASHTYTRDGILKLRIPFVFMRGSYDAKAGFFTVNKTDGTVFKGTLRFRDGKLILVQPDGRSEDVYVRDDTD